MFIQCIYHAHLPSLFFAAIGYLYSLHLCAVWSITSNIFLTTFSSDVIFNLYFFMLYYLCHYYAVVLHKIILQAELFHSICTAYNSDVIIILQDVQMMLYDTQRSYALDHILGDCKLE